MSSSPENRHGEPESGFGPEPVVIPITGELDLHTFAPHETAQVLDAYIEACLGRGIRSLRVIHGKGTGTLRETVHAFLRRDPRVLSFRIGDETSGGWGATRVRLKGHGAQNGKSGEERERCSRHPGTCP